MVPLHYFSYWTMIRPETMRTLRFYDARVVEFDGASQAEEGDLLHWLSYCTTRDWLGAAKTRR